MAIDKKNIFLSDTVKPYVYRAKSKFGSGPRIPQRIPTQHAATLKQDILDLFDNHIKPLDFQSL